jgi:hypothetical protein
MFGEISQTFGRGFLVANVLPAGILAAVSVLALKRRYFPYEWARQLDAFGVDRSVLLLIAVLACAILFSLFSTLIARLYEGYLPGFFYGLAGTCVAAAVAVAGVSWLARRWWPAAGPLEETLWAVAIAALALGLGHRAGTRYQRFRAQRAAADIAHPPAGLPRGLVKYRYTRAYPRDVSLVLPTKFGNILRAFESYPASMFGLDPITSWFRLVAVIPPEYRKEMESAQASTQFFLNASLISVMTAVGAVYVAFASGSGGRPAIVAGALVAVAYGLYRLACTTAFEWGEYVRGAFDMYRFDLLRQLRLDTPEPRPWSLETERRVWKRAQAATFYADPEGRIQYRPDVVPAPIPPDTFE